MRCMHCKVSGFAFTVLHHAGAIALCVIRLFSVSSAKSCVLSGAVGTQLSSIRIQGDRDVSGSYRKKGILY